VAASARISSWLQALVDLIEDLNTESQRLSFFLSKNQISSET